MQPMIIENIQMMKTPYLLSIVLHNGEEGA